MFAFTRDMSKAAQKYTQFLHVNDGTRAFIIWSKVSFRWKENADVVEISHSTNNVVSLCDYLSVFAVRVTHIQTVFFLFSKRLDERWLCTIKPIVRYACDHENIRNLQVNNNMKRTSLHNINTEAHKYRRAHTHTHTRKHKCKLTFAYQSVRHVIIVWL